MEVKNVILAFALVQVVFVSTASATKLKNLGARQSSYPGYLMCGMNEYECSDGMTCGTYCNGVQECSSGEDEDQSACACPGGMYTHQCMDGSSSCAVYCNGVTECSSGEDEEWCGCPWEQSYCYDDGFTCVNQCDGVTDCTDGEDEMYCYDSGSGWDHSGSGSGDWGSGNNFSPDCNTDEVKCIYGGCINLNDICSQMDSCSTVEDHVLCQDYGHIYGYYKRKVGARGLGRRVPDAELKRKAYIQATNRLRAKKRAQGKRRGFQTHGEKKITGNPKPTSIQKKSNKESDFLQRLLQALSKENKANRK